MPELTHTQDCEDTTETLEYWHEDCEGEPCKANECSDCGCYATDCGIVGN